MERKCKIVTIALFLIILFGVGLFTVLNGGKKYSVFEKRDLATFPKTNAKTIAKGKFQSGLDNFLNDHVVFRDQCIYSTTLVDKIMGRAEKAGVYFGKDGYLIEKSETATPKQIKANVKYLSDFVNMASEGIGADKVKVVLIPNKEYVLTDKMPKYAPVSNENIRMKEMLWNSLKDKNQIVDLTKGLQKHKDEYIYYKTDHHWTSLGAKYGYEMMMDAMGEKKLTGEKSKVVSDDFLGTTYNKIHYAPQKDLITKYDIKTTNNCEVDCPDSEEIDKNDSIYYDKALDKEDKYEYFMGGNFGVVNIHTGCTNGKTLVLLKDSFANCIIPFLTNNYENIVMIDVRYLGSSIFDTLNGMDKMDKLVVLFNEEKFMTNNHLYLLQ
ncbi:MAG: hypothetical protein K6E58_04885 [Eubacterium sp.]|nr:hypothetical protein [Eubacterium sp.]